jgi:hypothetical protein
MLGHLASGDPKVVAAVRDWFKRQPEAVRDRIMADLIGSATG